MGSIGEISAGILVGLCVLGSGLTWIWLLGRLGREFPCSLTSRGGDCAPSDLAALFVFLLFHWGFLLEAALQLHDLLAGGLERSRLAELRGLRRKIYRQKRRTANQGGSRRGPSHPVFLLMKEDRSPRTWL